MPPLHSTGGTIKGGHEKTPGAGEKAPGAGEKAPGAGEKAPGAGEKKPPAAAARVNLTSEPLTIAKGKNDGDLVIKVDREGDTGDVTLKLDAPPDVKLDKNEVIVPAGKDEATVKVTVLKRDKGEAMIKVTVSSAKAKGTTKEVAVKIEK